MILEKLSLINYKNIREATLDLSPKINCMIGRNGVGKTNILDAVYFLSFCHSASNPVDSMLIRHGEEFMLIEGSYKAGRSGSVRLRTVCDGRRYVLPPSPSALPKG